MQIICCLLARMGSIIDPSVPKLGPRGCVAFPVMALVAAACDPDYGHIVKENLSYNGWYLQT